VQVSMAQAAQQLNVSVDTVRRRLAKGELNGTQDPTPQGYRWLIDLPDTTPADPSIHPSDATAPATLDALLTVIGTLETQLAAQNNQIGELHRLLAQTALNAVPVRPWWKFWG